jgi:hypothetical protein
LVEARLLRRHKIFCAAATNFSASRNYCSSHELSPESCCGLSSADHYVVDIPANFVVKLSRPSVRSQQRAAWEQSLSAFAPTALSDRRMRKFFSTHTDNVQLDCIAWRERTPQRARKL